MSKTRIDSQQHFGFPARLLPRHIAIIMDGNGRWARQRGLPRMKGHEEGAKSVRGIVTHCARLGIEALTLFSFSTENWKRPGDEVDYLMGLYVRYLITERETIMENNVRFLHLGRRGGLPGSVLSEMDRTIEMSAGNGGLKLCLALNYGSRNEMVDAIRTIATEVEAGKIGAADVDETLVSGSLYTAGLPDPDLLIRTASERRLSNFLLWQISYAEIYVSELSWPEFGPQQLDEAIRDYARRERRYGGVTARSAGPPPSGAVERDLSSDGRGDRINRPVGSTVARNERECDGTA